MTYKNKIIRLSPKGSPENVRRILSNDMTLAELDPSVISGKGMQSSIFLAMNLNAGEPDYVVKYCKYPIEEATTEAIKGRTRFSREIQALEKVESDLKSDVLKEGIIKLHGHGTDTVEGKIFQYFVMEKADYDLTKFLKKEHLSLPQKIILCCNLLRALKALHKIGIYHRDIKPDNILCKDRIWKIGDLGLIAYRDEDCNFDGTNEKIGPTILLSPEANNKIFANGDDPEFSFDCKIDDMSDIFQLGKLFWYIFQGNYPTGQVKVDDFMVGDKEIFENILFPMLRYKKGKRPNIYKLDLNFKPIRERLKI